MKQPTHVCIMHTYMAFASGKHVFYFYVIGLYNVYYNIGLYNYVCYIVLGCIMYTIIIIELYLCMLNVLVLMCDCWVSVVTMWPDELL